MKRAEYCPNTGVAIEAITGDTCVCQEELVLLAERKKDSMNENIKSPWYKESDPRSTFYVEPTPVVRLRGTKTAKYSALIQWLADEWNGAMTNDEWAKHHADDGMVCMVADSTGRTNEQVIEDVVALRVSD